MAPIPKFTSLSNKAAPAPVSIFIFFPLRKEKVEGQERVLFKDTSSMLHRLPLLAFLWSNSRPVVTPSCKERWEM